MNIGSFGDSTSSRVEDKLKTFELQGVEESYSSNNARSRFLLL